MIEANDLSKSYGPIEALRGVSFSVRPGEIVGLLGPNGAGKSTLIKILTGYLQPDRGSAVVDGLDVLTQRLLVQQRIGYLPENTPLYPDLSVQAYLKLMADLRSIPPADQPALISAAVRAAGLQDHLTRPIGQLSKGFRQRVGIAQAILHRPRLLILDEPTIGLDPTQIVEIRGLIRRLAQHSTVLFSTHILPEVEALCDRVIILMNGQVRADARLADLAQSGGDVLLVLQEEAPAAAAALQALPGVAKVRAERDGGRYPAFRLTPRQVNGQAADLGPAVFDLARQRGWPVRELRHERRTLETIFNELATQA
ncbi:MAG: ABC transporter ATP-binding protein [Caldilineales bacterium]|nr:ABC transporter ATP-binding protein [Caldilineales bacterium]MDW8318226.1 ATP-binding cassette domain-containing protein [Anaerolineae bacterium]